MPAPPFTTTLVTPGKKSWAILVCRFRDDADPANVLVKSLPGIDPIALTDTGTVLDLFKMFFMKQGNATFNAVRFFNEMSHGSVNLNDSEVFVVNLIWTKAESDGYGINPGGAVYQSMITQAAQTAAQQQGVQLQNFYGIVITSHYFLAMGQGGPIPGGAIVAGPVGWTGMDYRYVRNNGTQLFGHEMGHGFGLDHSRVDGDEINDYKDPWDIMSARNAYAGPDPDYHMRGPGMNAWNMRCRGWLDENRVWHCPNGEFMQTLQLRPLHRKDLPGFLAAELPPMNDTDGYPRYLVEYRKKENWDNGIPRSCILVHRFEGPIGQFLHAHSYVMKGSSGQLDLVAGDTFAPYAPFGGPQLVVLSIDDATSTANVILGMASYPVRRPTYDPWWWIETRGGLVPPGPPPPWLTNLNAISALARAAETVEPQLRSSVLEIALKHVAILSREIEKQMKAEQREGEI
jgi:hypothetical protein